jgi:hypothetical protein
MLTGAAVAAAAIAQGSGPAQAQGSGRWTSGTPMASARTEIAVAEVTGNLRGSGASAKPFARLSIH